MLLWEKEKEGFVSGRPGNWCDGSVEEVECTEDVQMTPKETQPRGSGSGTTEHVGGSRGSLALVEAPPRPAPKSEKKKARALGRAAAPGY